MLKSAKAAFVLARRKTQESLRRSIAALQHIRLQPVRKDRNTGLEIEGSAHRKSRCSMLKRLQPNTSTKLHFTSDQYALFLA